MLAICPHCAADNKLTAKFCHVCGTKLTGLSAVTPVPAVSPPAAGPTALMPANAVPAQLCMPDGSSIDLDPRNTIGRDAAQCNLAFPGDTQLSRRHARIQQVNNDWVIEDLGSANGTYLNRQKIQSIRSLKSGDQIGLGSYTYVFLLANAPSGGGAIVPAQPPVMIPAVPHANLPAPSLLIPLRQPPPGGWRSWNTQPATEGHVYSISDRYTMKKDDLLKRGMAAAALAIFISPAVAFIPLMQGNEIAARDLRVDDHHLGHQVDVKILGDIMGNITHGDAIAIWGKQQGGLLIMESAFNYATQTEIRISRK